MTITVLQVLPNLGAGGAEQSCIDIVQGLRIRGDRAIVVSAGGVRVNEVEAVGGEHFQHDVASKNPLTILANAYWLAQFIRKHKVDIIHARSRAPAWSAWLASRMTGCPFVTTFHATYKFTNSLKHAYNAIMAKGDHVIAISQELAEHVRQSYGVADNRLTVIYRGVDFEAYDLSRLDRHKQAQLRQDWGVPDGKKIILMPARLSPIKGHVLLIEALAPLQPALDDVVTVIMGDDQGRTDYRADLERLIIEKGLHEKVLIVPHSRDMPTAYSLADLVVVPSQVPEGFGRVPVEAMAMGIPVLGSKLGGLKETILDGETGWLIPPHDAEAWRKAILKALEMDASQRAVMAEKAMKRARTSFNQRQMITETLSVYDDLLLQRR